MQNHAIAATIQCAEFGWMNLVDALGKPKSRNDAQSTQGASHNQRAFKTMFKTATRTRPDKQTSDPTPKAQGPEGPKAHTRQNQRTNRAPGPQPQHAATPARPPPLQRGAAMSGALPHGWEARQTGDGKVFYIDHVNKQTSWEKPQAAPGPAPGMMQPPPSMGRPPPQQQRQQQRQQGPSFVAQNVRDQAVPLLQADVSSQGGQSAVLGAGGVELMMHSLHDISLQQETLRMLNVLANGPCAESFADRFFRAQGIESMTLFLHNASDQSALSEVLSMLATLIASDSSGSHSASMQSSGLLTVLPRLMQSGREEIRSSAAFIAKIASMSQAQIPLTAEMCAACMVLLFSVSETSDSQILAAEILRNFSRWPSNAVQCWHSLAGSRHMLPKLVDLIQNFTRSGTIETAICSFLAYLTSHQAHADTASLTLLQEVGVHRSLLAALSSPHVAVQQFSVQTLGNAMRNPTAGSVFRREVFDFGGVALLESLLMRQEPEIKQQALFAIASLAQERIVADQLSLEPFVHLLKSTDQRTKAAALSIVDHITKGSDMKKAQLLGTSTLPDMIQMMSSPDPGTQRRAVCAVCAFSTDSSSWCVLGPAGANCLHSHSQSRYHAEPPPGCGLAGTRSGTSTASRS